MAGNNDLVLDVDLQRRIETFARERGSTPAEVVREAFEQYETHLRASRRTKEDGDTLYDLWNRAGLVGCIDDPDLPADLSTNPEYMKGFGRD